MTEQPSLHKLFREELRETVGYVKHDTKQTYQMLAVAGTLLTACGSAVYAFYDVVTTHWTAVSPKHYWSDMQVIGIACLLAAFVLWHVHHAVLKGEQ